MEALIEKLKLIPPARRAMLAAAAVVMTAAGWAALKLAYNSDFEVLYGNLGAEDAGRIVDRLKEAKVPYRLGAGGATLLVPSDKVDELRLTLASQGLPSAGGVGFELFDKTKLGVSGFAEKVQFRRALEGELSRTLSRMEGVRSARVHLALPDPSPFATEKAAASASVILHLGGGAVLSSQQIRGVVHLVSGAVEGLGPESVSVLDGMGRLLYSGGGDDPAGPGMDLKGAVEKTLENRAREIMDRLYGAGKAMVSVDAALDLDKLQSVRETYDPQTNLVRSSREVSEKAGQGGGGRSERQTSYELNKKVETFVKTPGGIRKLSAAVLINDPRIAPEQLAKIKAAVAAAIGLDETRGDRLTVEGMQFSAPDGKDDAGSGTADDAARRQLLRDLLRYGSLLLSALALAGGLLLAARSLLPAIAAASAAAAESAAAARAPLAAPAAPAPAAPAAQSSRSVQVTLSSLASEQPEVFSRALKKFMNSNAESAAAKKEAAGVN